MSKIDWKDPEQVRAYNAEYQRRWRELHRPELNQKAREANRNKPAGPGVKGRGQPDTGFIDAAYCAENRYAEEISWDLDKERIRKEHEE